MTLPRFNRICPLLWLLLPCASGLEAQLFTERAAAMGVEHHTYEPSAMGGGVAIFDFDNDGYEDLYLTGGDAPDKLYHNQGDGTFADVSRAMRITAFSIVTTMGVTAGDVDNDGFTDLFVTTTGSDRNYLLRNVEGKYFQDVSLPAGIRHAAWSTSAAMADYDGDGDLDIYVGNYVHWPLLFPTTTVTEPTTCSCSTILAISTNPTNSWSKTPQRVLSRRSAARSISMPPSTAWASPPAT